MNDDPLFDDEIAPESKSARKRQMHALQDLGEQLVSLSPAQLAKLDIDNETLIDSVLLAQRISHRSGKRRQMQFIGKLMRNVDAEQIAVALDELHETSRKAKAVIMAKWPECSCWPVFPDACESCRIQTGRAKRGCLLGAPG